MRLHGVIGLALAFCCAPLAAQQVLVSSAVSRPENSVLLPLETLLAAAHEAPVLISSSYPTGARALPAMLTPGALYEATLPQDPASACTQPLPPFLGEASSESDYVFSHLQFNSAAIKGAFRHDHIVKMARNFVPGQPLPDAPSYVPLTSRQKFDLFIRNLHSPGFAAGVLTNSFISQASGAYPRFGGGMEGYGQRLGAAAAGETSAALIGGYVFPTLLRQDPRYFRSHQSGVTDRLAYAASRVLIGRSDSGRNVVNASVIMSQFVQAAVSNAYIPYRNESVSGTLENALAGLGSAAQADILNEFWPDIKEFFSRHNPESLLHHGDSTARTGQLASK